MRLARPHHTVAIPRKPAKPSRKVKAARVSAPCARGDHLHCWMENCTCSAPTCSHGQYQVGKRE